MNALVTPPREVGTPGWDGHLLLLHRSEPERRAALTAWIRRGLERGEKIYYAESASEPRERRLTTVLRDAGVDAAGALVTRQLEVLAPAEFYPLGGQLPLIEQGLTEGYPAVRISAEMAQALTVRSVDWHNAAEWGFDGVSRSYPVSALCQHDASALAGARLDEVVAMHVGGIRERLLSSTIDDDGLALTGEVDISNYYLLASALRAAMGRTGDTFRLDLTRIDFIDARSTRTIVDASAGYRRAGGRLVLIAREQCAWVLQMLEVDRLENVTLLRGDR